jgi:hypothetical protein
MARHAEMVTVEIRQMPDGYFMAVSDDVQGLVLASRDVAEVLTDIPNAIAMLYDANQRRQVRVQPVANQSPGPAFLTRSWVVTDLVVTAEQMVA